MALKKFVDSFFSCRAHGAGCLSKKKEKKLKQFLAKPELTSGVGSTQTQTIITLKLVDLDRKSVILTETYGTNACVAARQQSSREREIVTNDAQLLRLLLTVTR
jgi:hypothetical protein